MTELIVYHDDGGGVTQRSLEYWKKTKQPDWQVRQVTCKNSGIFTTEVTCFDNEHNLIVVLLSGMNCGYGGEGPHGLLDLLTDCDIPVTDSVKSYVFERSYVSFGRFK